MSNIDSKISELLESVKRQREELAIIERDSKESWKTTCSVISEDKVPVNLQTAKESTVLEVVKNLLIHRNYAQQAHKLMGVTFEDKYQGFSYDDWFSDCRKRIGVVAFKQKKAQLDELEGRLNKIVSPEKRRELELENIVSTLGKLK